MGAQRTRHTGDLKLEPPWVDGPTIAASAQLLSETHTHQSRPMAELTRYMSDAGASKAKEIIVKPSYV